MTIWIKEELCDGCQRCIKACPYSAIEIEDGIAHILETCTSCGSCIEVCKKEAVQSDAKPKTIPDFSDRKGVWVFAEQNAGELTRVSQELLGKARELARDLDQNVSALLLGHNVAGLADTLIKYGADTVFLADHEALEIYTTSAYTDVVENLIKEHNPDILLIGATHVGRDLAPRLARRVGSGLTADCTELRIDPDTKILLQTRPAFGGNVMATIVNRFSRPQMATVRPGVMEIVSTPDNNGRVITCDYSLSPKNISTKILEIVQEKKPKTDIINAEVIVAGGRGVDGEHGFKMLAELADLLGGQVAGTRIAVEQGFVPPANQVGQTGKTVRPGIYIACGISGAVQHSAGMSNSKYIIAVNNDPTARIFEIADWGIVGDLHEIVPEIISQLLSVKKGIKARRSGIGKKV
jgi:caffeyl-CoA reductase-Etf complex subunit CarE